MPGHLPIEEFHDPGERIADLVRNEQESQPFRGKVRGDIVPEGVHARLTLCSQQGCNLLPRIAALHFGLALERAAQLFRGPDF